MKLAAAAALAFLVLAAPADAQDVLVQPAPGAVSLAAGGGTIAWLAPTADGRGQVTVRRPDGTVATPPVAPLPARTRLSLGADRSGALLAYARDGRATVLDLATLRERRVAPSLRRVRAVAVGAAGDSFAAATDAGVYAFGRRTAPRRLTRARAELVAVGTGRMAYVVRAGDRVVVRALSGRGRADTFVIPLPTDLDLTTYRLFATVTTAGATRVLRSERLGSGPEALARADVGPGVREIALGESRLPELALTGAGVVGFAPGARPFAPR